MTDYRIGDAERMAQWRAGAAGAPFDDERIAFVHTLSQGILTDPYARHYPELMAMAHWFRKAHVLDLQRRFVSRHARRQAAGTVFHLAPGNVDTVFMYSWLLSLLLGNRNIVRLSQRGNTQLDRLLSYVEKALSAFPTLAAQNLILSYGHDDSLTEQISALCDRRVTWGGDETVAHIQSLPLPANAQDIGFPDRFSMAAIDARSLPEAGDEALERLFHGFYNDTMWFDQRACSSPRLVVWVGDANAVTTAKRRFWGGFAAHINQRGAPSCATLTILRATIAMQWAANGWLEGESTVADLSAFPLHLPLAALPGGIRETHPGIGLFGEISLTHLSELSPLTTPKDQSLTVYGFDAATLAECAGHWHFSRIVPIGQALTFSEEWDGIDLMHALTA